MSSSPDISLLCAACGGQNAPDSKFCRHCGQSLEGAAIAASPAPDAPAAVADGRADGLALPDDVLPAAESLPTVVTAAAVANLEEAVLTSPGEIDARHARQLLERAQNLAERADLAGAILACRQAIALAPSVTGGQAMLGALLERNGDLFGALQALERAEQVAPDGAIARDIARLREKTAPKPDAPVFHFNDAELFGDDLLPITTSDSAAASIAVPVAAIAAPEIVGENGAGAPAVEAEPASLDAAENAAALPSDTLARAENEGTETPAPLTVTAPLADGEVADANLADAHIADAPPLDSPAEAPAAASSNFNGLATAVTAALPPSRERRVAVVPVRVERRINLTPGAFVPNAAPENPVGTPVGSRVSTPSNANVPAASVGALSLGNIDSAPQGWNALWVRPSYFGRSLPLVGATILALGFLGWARGHADASSSATPTVVVRAPASETVTVNQAPASAAPASNLPPLAPVGSAAAPGGGFPITNQTVASPPLAPPVASQSQTQTTVTRVVTAPPRRPARPRSSSGANPNFLAPAPIPAPGARPNPNSSGNSGGLILPPPVITPPPADSPAVSVLPAGSPLNPAGSSGRGYVRITQGRVGSILPQRPTTRAGDAERAAAAAARSGSTNQAIDGLTNAINASSSDAGFRFQQRAMLFLSQNDYARAADDFQSAITAYSDQIARGEQVASARAGLSAARSGLNRALAGGR